MESHFPADQDIDNQLAAEDGVWMNEEKIEVILKIDREVASYFKRRKLIANQVIEEELADGSLRVSAKVGHPNQVVPIVRYWIPHIRIISPKELQTTMEQDIESYLKSFRN